MAISVAFSSRFNAPDPINFYPSTETMRRFGSPVFSKTSIASLHQTEHSRLFYNSRENSHREPACLSSSFRSTVDTTVDTTVDVRNRSCSFFENNRAIFPYARYRFKRCLSIVHCSPAHLTIGRYSPRLPATNVKVRLVFQKKEETVPHWLRYLQLFIALEPHLSHVVGVMHLPKRTILSDMV